MNEVSDVTSFVNSAELELHNLVSLVSLSQATGWSVPGLPERLVAALTGLEEVSGLIVTGKEAHSVMNSYRILFASTDMRVSLLKQSADSLMRSTQSLENTLLDGNTGDSLSLSAFVLASAIESLLLFLVDIDPLELVEFGSVLRRIHDLVLRHYLCVASKILNASFPSGTNASGLAVFMSFVSQALRNNSAALRLVDTAVLPYHLLKGLFICLVRLISQLSDISSQTQLQLTLANLLCIIYVSFPLQPPSHSVEEIIHISTAFDTFFRSFDVYSSFTWSLATAYSALLLLLQCVDDASPSVRDLSRVFHSRLNDCADIVEHLPSIASTHLSVYLYLLDAESMITKTWPGISNSKVTDLSGKCFAHLSACRSAFLKTLVDSCIYEEEQIDVCYRVPGGAHREKESPATARTVIANFSHARAINEYLLSAPDAETPLLIGDALVDAFINELSESSGFKRSVPLFCAVAEALRSTVFAVDLLCTESIMKFFVAALSSLSVTEQTNSTAVTGMNSVSTSEQGSQSSSGHLFAKFCCKRYAPPQVAKASLPVTSHAVNDLASDATKDVSAMLRFSKEAKLHAFHAAQLIEALTHVFSYSPSSQSDEDFDMIISVSRRLYLRAKETLNVLGRSLALHVAISSLLHLLNQDMGGTESKAISHLIFFREELLLLFTCITSQMVTHKAEYVPFETCLMSLRSFLLSAKSLCQISHDTDMCGLVVGVFFCGGILPPGEGYTGKDIVIRFPSSTHYAEDTSSYDKVTEPRDAITVVVADSLQLSLHTLLTFYYRILFETTISWADHRILLCSFDFLLYILVTHLPSASQSGFALPGSALAMLEGIRDKLANRWTTVIQVMDASSLSFDPCIAFVVELFYARIVRHIIHIFQLAARTAIASKAICSLASRMRDCDYALYETAPLLSREDRDEQGINQYNDGARRAVLTNCCITLFSISTRDAETFEDGVRLLCLYMDTVSVLAPIALKLLLRGCKQGDREDNVLVSLDFLIQMTTVCVIDDFIDVLKDVSIPLPQVITYRKDPYHSAMTPREDKTNNILSNKKCFTLYKSIQSAISSAREHDGTGKHILVTSEVTDLLDLCKVGCDIVNVTAQSIIDNLVNRVEMPSPFASIGMQQSMANAALMVILHLIEASPVFMGSRFTQLLRMANNMLTSTAGVALPHIYELSARRHFDNTHAYHTPVSLLAGWSEKSLAGYQQSQCAKLAASLLLLLEAIVQESRDLQSFRSGLLLPCLFFCCRTQASDVEERGYYLLGKLMAASEKTSERLSEDLFLTTESRRDVFQASDSITDMVESAERGVDIGIRDRIIAARSRNEKAPVHFKGNLASPAISDPVQEFFSSHNDEGKAIQTLLEHSQALDSYLAESGGNAPHGSHLDIVSCIDPRLWPYASCEASVARSVLGASSDTERFLSRTVPVDRILHCLMYLCETRLLKTMQGIQ